MNRDLVTLVTGLSLKLTTLAARVRQNHGIERLKQTIPVGRTIFPVELVPENFVRLRLKKSRSGSSTSSLEFSSNYNKVSTTRGSLFWSRKVFEGVHSHVMDLLRKKKTILVHSIFLRKFLTTCLNPILVRFSIF